MKTFPYTCPFFRREREGFSFFLITRKTVSSSSLSLSFASIYKREYTVLFDIYIFSLILGCERKLTAREFVRCGKLLFLRFIEGRDFRRVVDIYF